MDPKSTPANTPPPPQEETATITPQVVAASLVPSSMNVGVIGSIILTIIFIIVYNYGAAKLSYSRYASTGWSILAFFFSGFYYPYYAFFVNPVPQPMLAGRRMRR